MFLIFVETPEFSSQFECIAPNREIAEVMVEKINSYTEEHGLQGHGSMVPLSHRVEDDVQSACELLEIDLEWMAGNDMI